MSKIKPIGSEKLQGNEKLLRIMEIAKYKEVIPNSINETSSVDYKITLADGNTYSIVKERLGYIIKKSINESVSDYIDNIKNRKHFSSYSSAMRKLNLMAGEINRVNGISEGISLFTEDKKYMLKAPQPKVEAPTETPSDLPPPAPEPEPSPAPAPEDLSLDMGPSSDEMPTSPEGEEMDTDMDDMGEEPSEGGEGEPVTFKSIQKLTGKLAQKIRDYSGEDELSSKDVKYVINSILSSLDLNSLDEEDKEEILTRFDGEEESDYGMEDMGSEDEESDEFNVDSEEETSTEEEPKPEEMGEADYLDGMFSKVFGESQVDKILKKYVVVNENEKKFVNEKKKEQKVISESRKAKYTKEIERLSLTESQSEISKKIVNNFPFITFVGKTNKGNLVFENNNKQLKVSPQGNIL
ncbi:hypothetical protein UFOVP117_327 [uncultured Caudovirales phage]|uniref:Uncharacterized protein n=1 Tax=uncultured Caudovirales phage TaxID=2100421 RepID=A0A6J5L781_9CAUD|nr:hypothetical protein UFOVP117_327 [uncultured Caudovirales phage]